MRNAVGSREVIQSGLCRLHILEEFVKLLQCELYTVKIVVNNHTQTRRDTDGSPP